MAKICIFAGTSDGRTLVERLHGRGIKIVACTATSYGGELLEKMTDVRVHTGRMDAAGMAAFFETERFDLVVDATHPYADLATENIQVACTQTNTAYMRLQRESGAQDSDGIFVPDVSSCIRRLKDTEGAVLLTTGSKDLSAFAADPLLRERLWVRVLPLRQSLDLCRDVGIPPEHILAMQGPFDENMNLAMLDMTGAQVMVTKDTGALGGYDAKIRAAKKAGALCIIIGRPGQTEGLSCEEIASTIERRFNLEPAPKKVFLIGTGMGDRNTRTVGMERVLEQADCLIGAKRMLEAVEAGNRPYHVAVDALEIAKIICADHEHRKFAVLLSGDTGFYSGTKKLLDALSGMEVCVLPGIGSLSYFCARLGRPWEDVRAVSMHGRSCNLVREVRNNRAVFVLLGGKDGANLALKTLCDAGLGHLRVHIGEKLSYPEEKIISASAQELLAGKFDPLSVLLIENPKSGAFLHGLTDEAFERADVPMTKEEIRSISLSKLQLTADAVVYDVGAGSGSVSIEAALRAQGGMVYAIEMKENAVELIRRNRARFCVSNLEIIHGKAPEVLEDLPVPTHAFIGGSGGKLREIINYLLKKNPQIRIVVNAVTLETISEMAELSRQFDFCDIAEVSVTKPRTLGHYRLMTAQNPVYIFSLQNGADVNG